MKKKQRIFLFGAGATLEWQAPTTAELTKLVIESGFNMSDSVTPVTKFIYETLLANGYKKQEVNFETIISVIEELVVYYADFDASQHIPSIHRTFFESKFEEEISNFTVAGGAASNGYELEIPKNVKYLYGKRSYQNETPTQFYFELLLGEILNTIINRIIEYAYHSENNSTIDFKSSQSSSYVDWMNLHANQTNLRMYSLNYDKIFKTLLEKDGKEIFEGFDLKELRGPHERLRPDIKRILSDIDANVFYNLHGSIYWDVKELDFHQLPHAEIFYSNFPNFPGNKTPASVQIEKGKTLMVTSLVTGYQKAQKAMITPFKQMQAAFDRDCCFAEEIYIIGYSFGDEHINGSLRTALRHNRNMKIFVVDPNFMKNNIDEEVSLKLFSATEEKFSFPKRIDTNVHSHNDTFIVYSMTFKEFRERQLDPFNKAAGGIISF